MRGEMNRAIIESLEKLSEILNQADDEYWVIGGAAFWIFGVGDGSIKDIDVVLSFRDAKKLQSQFGLDARKPDGNELFRSKLLLQLNSLPVPVELMAGLEVKTLDAWHGVLPITREKVRVGNFDVFVPSAKEMIEIALRFGREKDLARAGQLQVMLGATS